MSRNNDRDLVDFGDLPAAVNDILQQGVFLYRHDRAAADARFNAALALDPSALASYFCLYKIHTYQGHLDEAQNVAESGLNEAARQAGWDTDWRNWKPPGLSTGAERFALYTLKALAFIHLRQNNRALAHEILSALKQLDPAGATGWPVVAALAEGAG